MHRCRPPLARRHRPRNVVESAARPPTKAGYGQGTVGPGAGGRSLAPGAVVAAETQPYTGIQSRLADGLGD